MINILQFTNIGFANGISSMLLNYYRRMDRSKYHFIFLAMDNILNENTSKQEIESLGGEVITIPHYKKGLRLFIRNIRNVFDNYKIDIVHLHQGVLSIPLIIEAKRRKIKIIAHSHNPTLGSRLKNMVVFLSRKFINQNTDYRLACSQQSGDFLFGKAASFLVFPNAIELEKYKYNINKRELLRKQLNINDDDFVFICVGRFSKQKNQEFLLKVFYKLLQTNQKLKLILVGGRLGADSYLDIIEKMGITQNVLTLFDRKDVSDLLSASDCYLGPSIFEGLGISLLEAQINGLPCVFSDAIVKEILFNQNVTVLPLDEGSWIEKLSNTELLKRTDDFEALRKSDFNIDNTMSLLEKIYTN